MALAHTTPVTASDATLAQLSLDAYSDAPTLHKGFTAAPLAAPGLANGVFHADNAAALVATGLLDGRSTLVLAFRGSDDAQDSLNDLRGINSDYADFAALVQVVDAYAATGAVQQVVVTGHSLGGAMAQLYMAAHPYVAGQAQHLAVTFGSPGAQIAPAVDPRIENIVIADDPAVFLGAHRAEVGAVLRADPALAQQAAATAAAAFPGLTGQQALDSLPTLTANYVNHGETELLPAANGRLDPAGVLQGLYAANEARHAPELYAALTAQAAAGQVNTLEVPQQSRDPAVQFYEGLYQGSYPPSINVLGTVDQVVQGWSAGEDLLASARSWLAAHHHDFPFG